MPLLREVWFWPPTGFVDRRWSHGTAFDSPDADTFLRQSRAVCERYCEAYERMSELGPELVRRFANVTGGLTAFLERVMESGALDRGDKAELQVVLAKLMLGPVTTRAS